MSTAATGTDRPTWMTEADELPHKADPTKNWSENYLSYVYSPGTETGVYIHLCRLPGEPERWDEIFFTCLPGDRYLVGKSISRPRPMRGVAVNGVTFECLTPMQSWTKRFEGAAQLVSGEEIRSGPIADGTHIPVEMTLAFEGISPVYDFGANMPEQAWGTNHYEQHAAITGTLAYDGNTVELDGTGLRDHSWGPRDYAKIGRTTWVHGQFPESGRAFMVVRVTGIPPKPELDRAVTTDRERAFPASASGVPMSSSVEETEQDFEFELDWHGGSSRITAEILTGTRTSFHGAAQLVLGTDPRPEVNHDYVDAFTRFEWDGEVGYGITERTVDRAA